MGPGGGLTIFHGTKDTLVCGCYGQQPFLLSGRVPNAPKVCRRVKNHEMDWVRACKESASNRVQTKSNFLEAGPFNEMIVMGVLAVRLQGLHRTLKWDGNNMQFTNIGDNEMIKTCIRMVSQSGRTPVICKRLDRSCQCKTVCCRNDQA